MSSAAEPITSTEGAIVNADWRISEPGTEQVLSLHCSASSGRQWDELAGSLGDRYRVIAPDLYGYGKSEVWLGPGPLTLAEEAAHAASALPSDAQSVHVVGHSYGGAVALRFAMTSPDQVRSLTLIEPVAFHVLKRGSAHDRRLLGAVYEVAESVVAGVLSGDYEGAMERFVDYWNGDGAWSRNSVDTRRHLSRQAPKVVLDFHASTSEDAHLTGYRERFAFPVRIICGGYSPEPARRIAELLHQHIHRAELVTIAGAGHMLPVTHPERVNPVILEHIGGAQGLDRKAA